MSDRLRKAVSGTGSFPKKTSEAVQGCNIAKAGIFATLQCSFSGSNKVWWRVQRAPFQRCSLPLGERKTCLQVAFLTGLPVKSAFALLSQKVTKARRKRRNGKEVILCKERSAQWSEKAQSTTTAANSKRKMWTVIEHI